MEIPITITDNRDGTSTAVFPTEQREAVEQALYYRLRNQRIRERFDLLRKRMKYDDALDLLRDEFHLSRSSLEKIVSGQVD